MHHLWYLIGTHLGIPSDELTAIKMEKDKEGAKTCLQLALVKWFQTASVKHTWKTIIESMEKFDNMQLANNLDMKHKMNLNGIYRSSYLKAIF